MREFYHKTVTSAQIEQYVSRYAHKDLSRIFDQYLRTVKVPVLGIQAECGGGLSYRWRNCVKASIMR